MPKVRISFNGKKYEPENWDIDDENSSPPHLVISLGESSMAVTFENPMEQTRFAQGISFCRANGTGANTAGIPKPIYLTAI